MEPLIDQEEGRALFRALLSGEWSLVGPIEDGGERYYVARRNRPEAVRGRALRAEEAEVIRRAVSGQSYAAIARALGVPQSTIATRMNRALEKLGIESRAQLIMIAKRLRVRPDAD